MEKINDFNLEIFEIVIVFYDLIYIYKKYFIFLKKNFYLLTFI